MTCKHENTDVVDSRPPTKLREKRFPLDVEVVRRRKCRKCGHRFTTVEIREDAARELMKDSHLALLNTVGEHLGHLVNEINKATVDKVAESK